MGVFQIPPTLTEELERMHSNFWWGPNSADGGWLWWMRWEILCVRKEDGDMEFRDLRCFNLAMLGSRVEVFNGPPCFGVTCVQSQILPAGGFLVLKVGLPTKATFGEALMLPRIFCKMDSVRGWRTVCNVHPCNSTRSGLTN
ncbi:hypothetical protein LINGRAHAP2_LOCUS14579 [Linum grandiflorum]